MKLRLFALPAHDFSRLLRRLALHMSPMEILQKLSEQRGHCIKLSVRSFVVSLAASIWLTTSVGGKVELNLPYASVAVPLPFVVLATSGFFLTMVIHCISYLAVNMNFHRAAQSLLRLDSARAASAFFDADSSWSDPVLAQFRFFSSSKKHRALAPITLLTICAPIILLVGFIAATIFTYAWQILTSVEAAFVDQLLSASSLLLVLFSILYVILCCLRFKFDKNRRYVRWNFLHTMHRRAGTFPPRIYAWVAVQEAEEKQKVQEAAKRRFRILRFGRAPEKEN